MPHNPPDNPENQEDILKDENPTSENASWGKIDKVIDAFRQSAIATASEPEVDCPMTETTLSYALGEIEPEKRDDIRSHLLDCSACWDLYFDARASDAAAQEEAQNAMATPPAVSAAIADQKTIAPHVEGIRGVIRNLLSFFHAHSAISVPAACSVLIVVAAAIFFHQKDDPISASLTMIAHPPFTRSGSQPVPRQIQPGDVVLTGERYRLRVEANEKGYAYVILAGSSGRIATLFSGPVPAGKPIYLPGENEWAQMDPWTGEEALFLIVSKNAIGGFEEKAAKLEQIGIERIGEIFEDAEVETLRFSHER